MGFLKTFLVSVLSMAVAYAAIVCWINPRAELWGGRFWPVITNSRKVKLALFEEQNRRKPIEGLLLGSSRSMKLDPSDFERATGLRFFNLAVENGIPEDYLGLYRLLRRQGIRPKMAVVGLDHDIFRPEHRFAYDFEHNVDLRSELDGRAATGLDHARAWLELGGRVFTRGYALDAWRGVKVRQRESLPEHVYLPNGKLRYPRREALLAAGRYGAPARIASCARTMAVPRKAVLDTVRIRMLDEMLAEMRADGVRVIVWWTPQHPSLTAKLDSSPDLRRALAMAIDTVNVIAAARQVPVVDLRDPTLFDADSADWYDCVHYADANAKRIAEALVVRGL